MALCFGSSRQAKQGALRAEQSLSMPPGTPRVTGSFSGTATFGAGETKETRVQSAGYDDIFAAKYDPNGSLVWARRAGSTSTDYAYGMAVDTAGNSFVTGTFSGMAIFGPGEPNETTLAAASWDIFVAKYTSDGILLWAKQAVE
jgi:hypothetical protein